jgi:predicted nuclease of predicted toxin-antitoxin system
VPHLLARARSARGHPVEKVRDVCPGGDDEAVLREAVKRAAVLVTLDQDFGSLVFLRGRQAPAGVALIRMTPAELADSAAAIVQVLESALAEPGMFVVLGPDGVRARPMASGRRRPS